MTGREQELCCFKRVKKCIMNGALLEGLSADDRCQLAAIFCEANPNPKHSEFPDFVCGQGFIEHFQVTSTLENSKGSQFQKAANGFERECEKNISSLETTPADFSAPITLNVTSMEMVCSEASYENFVQSFKKNWEHHIKSRQNYCGTMKKCVFLIELSGAPITILKNGKFADFYRLAADSTLLHYIKDFQDLVDYVVFTFSDRVECLAVKDIPKNIHDQADHITFGVGRLHQVQSCLQIDMNPNLR